MKKNNPKEWRPYAMYAVLATCIAVILASVLLGDGRPW